MRAKKGINVFRDEFSNAVTVLRPICIVAVDDMTVFLGAEFFRLNFIRNISTHSVTSAPLARNTAKTSLNFISESYKRFLLSMISLITSCLKHMCYIKNDINAIK